MVGCLFPAGNIVALTRGSNRGIVAARCEDIQRGSSQVATCRPARFGLCLSRQFLITGDIATLRFSFAFSSLDERYGDLSPIADITVRLFFCKMSEGEPSLGTQTPILDSGVLPPRTRRKITMGTVAGFLGGVLAGLSIVKVVGEQASGSSNFALGIFLFFAAFSLAILLHEVGHLTAGWLLGFRFSQISVGPIQLRLEHGRLKLSFMRELTALGFAGMHVDTVIRLRRRFLVYAAAGAAANLITIPLATILANHTHFAARHPSFVSFAAQLSMISFLLSVVSLLPLPVWANYVTDGFQIATLLKDRQRTRRLLSMCRRSTTTKWHTSEKLEANLVEDGIIRARCRA